MMRRFISAAAICTFACSALAEVPVQPLDIAFGINNAAANLTAEQVRDDGVSLAEVAGRWTAFGFVQSTEFDNASGVLHNNVGNLLALNFGTTAGGGSLYNLSTNGADAGQTVFLFDGGSSSLSRTSGLSVSPNNDRIAAWGYDTGTILLLNYTAGGSLGTGAGASATSLGESAVVGITSETQGTAWLDNDTAMIGAIDPNDLSQSTINVATVDVTGGVVGATTTQLTLNVPGAGDAVTDIEFNPNLSDFVFVSVGRNTGGVTTNIIYAIDPASWTVVDTINISNSAPTLREIALGPDARLYVCTFGTDIEYVELDLAGGGDGMIDAADLALVADDSSELYFFSQTFNAFCGLDVAFGTAAETGACCLSVESCIETTEIDCLKNQNGTFIGNGIACGPDTCLPPTGACCVAGSGCISDLTFDECDGQGGVYQGDNTVCGPDTCPLPPLPVLPGDMAFGLSVGDAFQTAAHVRNGNRISRWTTFTFVQSFEFDNHDGTLHNATGNLLALNFGSGCSMPPESGEGGGIYNLSTDGSNNAEQIYSFSPADGGIACTRVAGLGISPDNSLISLTGFDDGNLYVLEYNEGATPGTGAGASIGQAWSDALGSAFSQGTTWLDNDTILMGGPDPFGDPFLSVIRVIDFNSTTGAFTLVADVEVDLFPLSVGGSLVADIEYNPSISPYIYFLFSGFSGGTTNVLAVVDPVDPNTPATWNVLTLLDLSTSLQTGREIALGPDYRLYLGQFAQGGNPQIYADVLELDLDNDDVIDMADTLGLTDDSSVDWYTQVGGTGTSFNGLDVAHGKVGPPCGACGDSNCDGNVSVGDINFFVAAVTGGEAAWNALFPGGVAPCDFICANDTNGDSSVTVGDINNFVTAVTSGQACQ